MNRNPDVIVVGAGVIGLCCAYYLSRAGRSVAIVEKASVGHGSSFGNCGLITPSHARPLTQPGMVGKALKWMAQHDAPFFVRPRFDPGLWSWFLQFARRCREDKMREALVARRELLNASRTLYDELIDTESLACEWTTQGVLSLCRTQAGLDQASAIEDMLSGYDLAGAEYNGNDLRTVDPAIADDVVGGYLHEADASLHPNLLLDELVRVLRDRDVRFLENTRVTAVDVNRGRVTGLASGNERLEANDIVLATGSWSPKLARWLKLKIPIQPGKGYSVTLARPDPCPGFAAILTERLCSVTPWSDGFRVGGTMEFSGYNTKLDRIRLDALLRACGEYYRSRLTTEPRQEWFGWRPMTYDGIPVIDRSPKHDNVFVAAGHNMLGVSMAPGTGRLIAELVTGSEPHIDPNPYSLKRFGN